MKRALQTFWKDESGQTATEYMLLLSIVVLAVVSSGVAFRDAVKEAWETMGDRVKDMVTVD